MVHTPPPAPLSPSAGLPVPRLTREDIAKALDVAVSTVEAYASGQRAIPPDRRRRYVALLYSFAAEVERLAGEEAQRANG